MAGLFLATLVFLVLVVSGSHAVFSPSELYWKTLLPETPIPSVIQDLLKSNVEKTFSLKNGNMGPLRLSPVFQINYPPPQMRPDPARPSPTLQPDPHGHGPNDGDFLLQKDLQPGTTMTLHLQRSIDHVGFLPRDVANSIPFSSADLPTIFTRFNVKPRSPESKVVEEVLHDCEAAGLPGERKHCATSVESMLDFAASTIGTTHLAAMFPAPPAAGAPASMKNQEYTIASPGARRVTTTSGASSKAVTCHPLTYPYALYYCHLLQKTTVYEVPVVGKDGSRVTAVVACHADTASWNAMHVSFQLLKVKPGTEPICHFIPEDNLIFVPGTSRLISSS